MDVSDDEGFSLGDLSESADFNEFNESDSDDAEMYVPVDKGKGVDQYVWIPYRSFSPEDLRAEIDRETEAIVSVLGISRDLALIFLMHYRWNRDKLIEQYSDFPSQVLFDVGEQISEEDMSVLKRSSSFPQRKRLRQSSTPLSDGTCGVCFDELIDVDELPQTRCKHNFCRECWGGYLTSNIKSDGQCAIRCMSDQCKALLPEGFIRSILDDELYERWQTLLVQSFVSATSSLRFCPAPACSEAVQCSIGASSLLAYVPTVLCSKNHSFCFRCGLADGHTPVLCKVADLWLTSKDDSGTTSWINANTRRCPKCNGSIEKAGGCNRMVCRHCKFQFCWVCLKKWDVHGYNKTVCNSYVEPPRTSTMDEAKANLERWMFYYDRFLNHEVSMRLEEELVRRSKEKMLHIQNNSTLSWIETHFIQNAVEELSKCRRALKWSYAMGYYLASGNKKHIFEDIQSDLEKAVEVLSQLINEPIEDAYTYGAVSTAGAVIRNHRQKVIDKTIYVQKRHKVLLDDVLKGNVDELWDWTVQIY